MSGVRILPSQRSSVAPGAGPSSAELFSILWEGLVDLLGAPITAVIVGRAARRAERAHPSLAELVISAEKMDHRYAVPRAWMHDSAATPPSLQALLEELMPLLRELTGPLALRRLQRLRELRARGLRLDLPEVKQPCS